MKAAKELYDLLKGISKKDDDVIPAIVKVVNEDGTVDCDFDSYTLAGCRTQSISDFDKGIRIKPTVGSVVLLKRIGETNEFFVCMYSSIDEHVTDTGNMMYKINEEGHLIKGGNDTLLQAVLLLIEAVEPIIVLQGRNYDPVKLAEAKQKFQNILQ